MRLWARSGRDVSPSLVSGEPPKSSHTKGNPRGARNKRLGKIISLKRKGIAFWGEKIGNPDLGRSKLGEKNQGEPWPREHACPTKENPLLDQPRVKVSKE